MIVIMTCNGSVFVFWNAENEHRPVWKVWNPGKSFSPFSVEGHSPSHMRSIGSWEGVEGASIKITTRIANLNRSGVIATCVHNVSTESRVGQRSIRSEVVVRTHNHTHTHTHTQADRTDCSIRTTKVVGKYSEVGTMMTTKWRRWSFSAQTRLRTFLPRFVLFVTCHFSGAGRAIGPLCVCACARASEYVHKVTLESNDI